jgi:hypothetical protein
MGGPRTPVTHAAAAHARLGLQSDSILRAPYQGRTSAGRPLDIHPRPHEGSAAGMLTLNCDVRRKCEDYRFGTSLAETRSEPIVIESLR